MVRLEKGAGGLQFIEIENQAARASICLLGATVMEYQPAGSAPVLWTSPNSRYQAGTPIRAGIPVCWPWFGQPTTPDLPPHGFARTRLWEVARVEDETPGRSVVELSCTDDDSTHQLWPHRYDLRLRVSVGAELGVALLTTNRDEQPFPFSAALHTYFAVSDIANIQINGLENVPFLSKVHQFQQFVEAEPVRIGEQVDRVYLDTLSTCQLHDSGWHRRIVIEKEGSRTTVVWNPWAKISAEMADLGPDMYRQYVCVESVVGPQEHLELPPSATHTLTARIRVEPE
jgi:glucose-6-phosphate 1-epimerase